MIPPTSVPFRDFLPRENQAALFTPFHAERREGANLSSGAKSAEIFSAPPIVFFQMKKKGYS